MIVDQRVGFGNLKHLLYLHAAHCVGQGYTGEPCTQGRNPKRHVAGLFQQDGDRLAGVQPRVPGLMSQLCDMSLHFLKRQGRAA